MQFYFDQGTRRTYFDEDTRRIMEYLDENYVAFSQQIAGHMKLWFTDVEERLDLLVELGYADVYIGQSGSHIYSLTERCSKYLHGDNEESPRSLSFLGRILDRVVRRDYR